MTGSTFDTLRTLEAEANRLADLCNELPVNDPNAMLDAIRVLVSAIADCGRYEATAGRLLRDAKGDAIAALKAKDSKLSGNELKALVEAETSFHMYVCEILESAGSSLTKALDAARTAISYAKTEMQNLTYMEG